MNRAEYKRKHKAKMIASKLCISCGNSNLAPTSTRLCVRCFYKDIKRNLNNRRKLQQQAFEYCGSQCFDCGFKTTYLAVYDFHHLRDKKYNLSQMFAAKRGWGSVQKELDKCVMLCANCHRIRHAKEFERKKT